MRGRFTHWTIKALENCWVCRSPHRRAYYGQGRVRVWPHNRAPLPHGKRRTLWNMRGEICLIGVLRWCDQWQLSITAMSEGKRKKRKWESDWYYPRVMMQCLGDTNDTPIPPLFLLSARFRCSAPPFFFSGAQNRAFRLVNSTIEMLRISTNQGPGAPSHRYHSNLTQPQWACTHVYSRCARS